MDETPFPLTVPEEGRADSILAAAVEGLTRSAAQRWLEEGRVTKDGTPIKKNTRLQPGDVPVTYADTSALERDFGFKPTTSLRDGLRKFAEWYKEYYKV